MAVVAQVVLLIFTGLSGYAQTKVPRAVHLPTVVAGDSQNTFLQIQQAFKDRDHLALRVLIKRLSAQKPSVGQWSAVRRMLMLRPQVGYDFIIKWDRFRPAAGPGASLQNKFTQLLQRADDLMLEEKFEPAFKIYQTLSRYLKKELARGKKENRLLYWSTIHAMGRALFGAGRLKEALEVYNWIPSDYFKFRQVLFEKMWTAFRANRLDVAVGAIASQQSSYFSDYLEPETYLVEIYIYKKLCRTEEQATVGALLEKLKRRLDPKSGDYNLDDWAKSDIETAMLYQLLQKEADGPLREMKLREQEKIKQALNSRFMIEKQRLGMQIGKVIAFSRLSVAMDRNVVVSDIIPDRDSLMKSKKEFWPVDDAEDWSDEVGQHLYIGESRCKPGK